MVTKHSYWPTLLEIVTKDQRAISAPTRWQSKKDRQVAEQRKNPTVYHFQAGSGSGIKSAGIQLTPATPVVSQHSLLFTLPLLSHHTLSSSTNTNHPSSITHLNGQDNHYNHTAMDVSPSHEQQAGSPEGQSRTVILRGVGSIGSLYPVAYPHPPPPPSTSPIPFLPSRFFASAQHIPCYQSFIQWTGALDTKPVPPRVTRP